MGDHRTERLLRDGLGQDYVCIPVLEGTANGGQLGTVVGEGVALLALIGRYHRVGVLEGEGIDVQVVLVGEVLQVQLGGCSLSHADGSVLKLQGAGDAQVLLHQEPLAVVEHGLGVVAPLGVPGCGPGDGANQQVHFAGLDGGSAFGSGDQPNLEGICITQDSGGNGAAKVDIETDVIAGIVQEAIARHVVAAGTDELASVLDCLETGTGRLVHAHHHCFQLGDFRVPFAYLVFQGCCVDSRTTDGNQGDSHQEPGQN